MNPELINPETLEKIVEGTKIGSLIVGLSLLGLATTFAAIYTAVQISNSNFSRQFLRYVDDLAEYGDGRLKEKPRFRDYITK